MKKLLGQIPISSKVPPGEHLIRQGESLFLTLNKSDNWQGAFEKFARLGNSEGCLEPLTEEATQAMVVNVQSMVAKFEEGQQMQQSQAHSIYKNFAERIRASFVS